MKSPASETTPLLADAGEGNAGARPRRPPSLPAQDINSTDELATAQTTTGTAANQDGSEDAVLHKQQVSLVAVVSGSSIVPEELSTDHISCPNRWLQ